MMDELFSNIEFKSIHTKMKIIFKLLIIMFINLISIKYYKIWLD